MHRPVTLGQAHDISDMVALQPQWRLDYQQLSAGRYLGRIVSVSLPGLHLTLEASNRATRQQGSLFEQDIGLALAESPARPCRFHGQVADRHTAMVGLGGELDLLTPDDCQLLGVQIPRARFLATLWQIYPHMAERLSEAPTVVELCPDDAQGLRHLIRHAASGLWSAPTVQASPSVARHVQDGIVLAWQEALAARRGADRPEALPRNQRHALIARACEHVRAQLPEPPTMLALCSVLGASPRKLEYCFQDVLGMTPARYLRLMRLNGVHQDLVRAAANVMSRDGEATPRIQDIAARWGFWHMGAFAGEYRRLFGRPPSQTLRHRPTSPG